MMNEELKNAIKEIGRKHTELNWYYKAVNGHYDLTDEQSQKIQEIEDNYPYDCKVLQKERDGQIHKDLIKAIPQMEFNYMMEHSYNEGVEAALTWVMAANELGIEIADRDYII